MGDSTIQEPTEEEQRHEQEELIIQACYYYKIERIELRGFIGFIFFAYMFHKMETFSIFASLKRLLVMSKFKTIFLDEARDFILSLPEQPRSKIVYNIHKVEGGVQSNELFKKLEGTDIWEFRTLYNGIQYRLFAFWDTKEDTLVVATHGMIKKVWKVPSKEIAKAEEIRKQYFNSK